MEAGFGDIREELKYFRENFEDEFGRPPKKREEEIFRNKWEEMKGNEGKPPEPHPGDRAYDQGVTPRDYDRYSRTAEDELGYDDIQTGWGGDFENHLKGNTLYTWNEVISPELNPRNPRPHHLVYEDSKKVNEYAARRTKELTEELDEKVTALERLHYSLNRGDATQKQVVEAAEAAEELQRRLPDLRETLGNTFAEQIATDAARQQKKEIKRLQTDITELQEFLEGVESTLDDFLLPR